MATVGIKGLNN